ERAKWTGVSLETLRQQAHNAGIDDVAYLGKQCAGYQFTPFFSQDDVIHLLDRINATVAARGLLYTLCPDAKRGYIEQRHLLAQLASFAPELRWNDVSEIVADLRRTKDMRELEQLFKAIEITAMAHEAAAHVIASNVYEYQVQAAIEYIFTEAGAQRPAYPSIVASGFNSTVLHYDANQREMSSGDLVVVDIGAEYNYYCADLTRTYPVSGMFTKRQREIYDIVLDTQAYVVDIAKPGMWLSNPNQQEQSLHHRALAFLQERGYAQYLPHNIGHFLGLDVHDVGDRMIPLRKGDVFTIEPGIYIPDEQLGVRIEDNYMMGGDAVVCLSADLPSDGDTIQEWIRNRNEFESQS
ncbi:M24 family metallopeptidase, partial [Candidatus Babeliales bacterium]|nr:M24 family metallopeptidase [Candidatus Babeliales bacterium]